MMTPVGRLVVLRTTEKKDLLNTIALIIWPGLLAPVMGPAVGGFITTYFSWRWIFLLNLPLGLTGLGLTLALVPNLRDGSRRRLDGVGFVLSGVCVTAVVFGLDALGEHPLSAGAWLALALGAATGLAAARHFERHPWPLLDFRAMKRRTFSVYVWGGSVFRAVIATPPFLMPLMFQLAFGMDAFRAGLLTMAIFAGNIAIKPLTSAILRAFGFRTVLLVNGAFVAASLAVCGLFQPDTSPLLIAAALFAGGASRSLQFTALSTLQFAEIPSEEMNGANTLSSAVAQITSGLGVAIAALALDICAGVSGSHESPPTLVDFHAACFLIAAFSLIALLDWICLPRDAGDIIARRGEHGRG
jgi:MFS family permease